EGLALARQNLPDVIVTDIRMPGTDGRSVLRMVREDPNLGHKQVVLMTGNPRDITPRSGMELGADDFLVKPFGLDELIRCVEARLQRGRVNWRVEDKVITSLRANLHKALPHEFFTPLAGIIGLVEILKDECEKMPPAEIKNILTDIETSGWRLQRTLRNYLLIINEEGTKPRTSMLPGESVRDVIAQNAQTVADRAGRTSDLQLEIEAVSICGDSADLAAMVEELVDNACNYSTQGSPVSVRLNGRGVLEVEDRGRGLTSEQKRRIGAFQQFDREKFEQQGLGLGLTLVKRLAKACGARFSLQSSPGSGTCVILEFSTDGSRPFCSDGVADP
ncbi:MAG TPA: hybrid sensor histidine kinase/response regulator, partial [Opitutaceae bacterium]|nr:hybrid sensor histidine kinase/response regulator [Opitutaceae bacterium]